MFCNSTKKSALSNGGESYTNFHISLISNGESEGLIDNLS
jgi:hypothetical protein